MINEKDLDQLFEDSLGGMQQQPSSDMWSDISEQLNSIDATGMDIDDTFRESLSDYKQTPSSNSWSTINDKMNASDAVFDNSFYNSLSDYSTKPAAQTWQNVEAGLDAYYLNNNRKYLLWFTMAASVVAVFWYMFMNIVPTYNQHKLQQNSKPKLIVISKDNTSNNYNQVSDNKDAVANNNTESTIKSDFSKKQAEKSSIINKQTILNSVNNNSNKNGFANNNNNNSNQSKQLNQENTFRNNTSNGVKNKRQIVNTVSVENRENSIIRIESIQLKDIISNENTVDESKILSKKINIASPTNISSIHAATSFSLDIFTGPEFIKLPQQNKISDNENISFQTKENIITDFTIGANLKFHYNNLFIQSGVAYSNFGYKSDYLLKHEMHDTTGGYQTYQINTWYDYDTIGWRDDPLNPGAILPILSSTIHTDTMGSTWNSQDSTYYNYSTEVANNRYRYIEIPLMVGYRYSIKNFSISIAAGGSYGFKVAEQGKYLINNQIIDISELHTPYSNNVINGMVNIGLEYSLNKTIAVIFQPTYKTNLINFDSGFNSKATKYHNVSLRLGLNIKL